MDVYKISGGIIYALLSEIRYVNSRALRYDKNKKTGKVDNPCDNLKLLKNIASIVGDEFSAATITRKTVSLYKTCQGQGGLGFDKNLFKQQFDYGIENCYDILLAKTQVLLKDCIINDEIERNNFVRKTWYLLSKATNIDKAEFIYLDKKYTKPEFLSLKAYDFPAFVLSVLHSVMTNVMNNRDGKNVFNNTFEYVSADTEYHFKEELLIKLPDDIQIVNSESPSDEISYNSSDFIIPKEKTEPQPGSKVAQCEIVDDNCDVKSKENVPVSNTGIISYGDNATNIVNNGFMTLNIGANKNDK